MENTNDVEVKIEEVQMSPDEIQRIKSEAEGEFLFRRIINEKENTQTIWPYHKSTTGEWQSESLEELESIELSGGESSYMKYVISKNGQSGIISTFHRPGYYDRRAYTSLYIFERDLHNAFAKEADKMFKQDHKGGPLSFSTVIASDGSFFIMTHDDEGLLHWFKDNTGTWTSEAVATSNNIIYKHPELAPDLSYFLTTTGNNDINIWERDAEGKWRQSSATLHSPQTIDAFYIAPNSKCFITVNKTSRTAVFWSRNSQGQWENQTFDGVDGGINKYKNLNTPQVAFANDSKSFVITGLNEEGGYRIS